MRTLRTISRMEYISLVTKMGNYDTKPIKDYKDITYYKVYEGNEIVAIRAVREQGRVTTGIQFYIKESHKHKVLYITNDIIEIILNKGNVYKSIMNKRMYDILKCSKRFNIYDEKHHNNEITVYVSKKIQDDLRR